MACFSRTVLEDFFGPAVERSDVLFTKRSSREVGFSDLRLREAMRFLTKEMSVDRRSKEYG